MTEDLEAQVDHVGDVTLRPMLLERLGNRWDARRRGLGTVAADLEPR